MKNHKFDISWLCEYAANVTLSDSNSSELPVLMVELKQQIERCDWVTEVVLCYNSLAVFYDTIGVASLKSTPEQTCYNWVKSRLYEIIETLKQVDTKEFRQVELEVKYGSEDLEQATTILGLSEKEIIEIHSSSTYQVVMLGFLPGFAYMTGVADEIQVPRKEKPTLRVPRGSVAIANAFTGIYPSEGPGGWFVIGKCKQELFDVQKMKAFFKVGDRVRFKPS